MAKKSYPPNGSRTPEAKARRETHWRDLLERWRQSGLPKSEFFRREGVSRDVLDWWQAEIHKRDLARWRRPPAARPRPDGVTGGPAFVPVRVVEPASHPSSSALEILAGGRVVRVRAGFDAETLGRLLSTLEGRAC
jgi:hypothetical protein